MPMRTIETEEYEVFGKAIKDELPAFVADLLAWEIPPHILGGRFGVQAYQHPYVMGLLNEISPELHFLEVIDETRTLWHPIECGPFPPKSPGGRKPEWLGNATHMEAEVTSQNAPYREIARKLCQGSAQKCGGLLSKLCDMFPERFRKVELNGKARYRIKPPKE